MSKTQLQLDLEKNLIKDSDHLVGKTIKQAYLACYPNCLYLRLNDDQFCMVQADPSYDNTVEMEFKEDVDAYEDYDHLVKIGIMTQTQVDEHQETRLRERELAIVRQQRAEYEKLKKIFDSSDL